MAAMVSTSAGYSADVKLTLIVDDLRIELAAVGPHQFTARNPVNLLPCPALLEMVVDGQMELLPVVLTSGMKRDHQTIPVQVQRTDGKDPVALPDLQFFSDPTWIESLKPSADDNY